MGNEGRRTGWAAERSRAERAWTECWARNDRWDGAAGGARAGSRAINWADESWRRAHAASTVAGRRQSARRVWRARWTRSGEVARTEERQRGDQRRGRGRQRRAAGTWHRGPLGLGTWGASRGRHKEQRQGAHARLGHITDASRPITPPADPPPARRGWVVGGPTLAADHGQALLRARGTVGGAEACPSCTDRGGHI